jgi:hypothetical protein
MVASVGYSRWNGRTRTHTRLLHYQAGELHDPVNGKPAVQTFDAASGVLKDAVSCQNGIERVFSAAELDALRDEYATPALPGAIRRLLRPDLKPT